MMRVSWAKIKAKSENLIIDESLTDIAIQLTFVGWLICLLALPDAGVF